MYNIYNNIVSNRTCTNLFMCIIFVILIMIMFILAIMGWSKPNYTKLTTVYDATGVGCGVKGKENPEYVDYPYAYFVAPEY